MYVEIEIQYFLDLNEDNNELVSCIKYVFKKN